MGRARRRTFLPLLAALALVPSAWAQNATIRLSADLREAPRRIFHARLEMPVRPGPLTLLYPKWIPGEHAPDGRGFPAQNEGPGCTKRRMGMGAAPSLTQAERSRTSQY